MQLGRVVISFTFEDVFTRPDMVRKGVVESLGLAISR